MNLKEYASERRSMGKYNWNNDIIERWNTRILPAQLHEAGELGAQSYLSRYGKSIGFPKCIMLARYAEQQGALDMALGFWKKAYMLEMKQEVVTFDPAVMKKTATVIVSQTISVDEMELDFDETLDQPVELHDFPAQYQPGKLVTMQPTDAANPRSFYIADDRYYGQPKRDGNKLIVFATPTKVWYQSRQLKVDEVAPTPQMDVAFRSVATHSGSFVLEGELFFVDDFGNEHMTGATCLAANAKGGKSGLQPLVKFSAFGALFTNYAIEKKIDQVLLGQEIMRELRTRNPSEFEVMPLAKTLEEKQELADYQKANEREGEVWFRVDLPTRPGKITSGKDPFYDGYVRTKYSIGIQRYRITAVAPSRAAGHTIGGFSIQDTDGNDVGTVGTGYTRDQQVKILELFQTEQAAWVLVDAQTKTVYGKLRHARFIDFAE